MIEHDIEAMKIVAKLIFNGMYSFLFYGIFLYCQSVFMIILTGRWVYKIINQLKQFNKFIGEVTFYGASMIKEKMEIVNELGKNIVLCM